ncbi:unnamed protein product [Didymodactylos carnosus]|uniref:Uncharacterized protein n=1 Tax=Didymodactylos carnosus TaxID=1234261 RepID=A0A814UL71_9BILA|nr:unnamed protein product [Didymodactylos carnosus]CAF1327497.1 unnamed protein product [Didymodactylos carnosus]CAF3938903.1 unnamed protein product [Didymodactylos carnosus]CAF4139027.1 unnamed protein product [Didymodactylos carnosus]
MSGTHAEPPDMDFMKQIKITFDGIPNAATSPYGKIPNGYQGLNWENAWYMHESHAKNNSVFKNSGASAAFTRGKYVGGNNSGKPMYISSSRLDKPFNVHSFEANSQ